MRTYILSLLAILSFATPALAEWQHVGADDKAEFYIHQGDVRKNDGFAYAWFLRDHSEPLGGMKSFVMLAKVDCENTAFKQVQHIGFFGPKATGKHVNLPKLGWVKPARNATNAKVIRSACLDVI